MADSYAFDVTSSTLTGEVRYWKDLPEKPLLIQFTKTGYYTYYDVPIDVFEAFRDAPSKGKFFHNFIKGRYAWKKGNFNPEQPDLHTNKHFRTILKH